MGRVVHFEFFAADAPQLADYYREVFGWDISTWAGGFEYHLVGTGPREEVGIDGAIAPFGSAGDQRVVVTVDVDDLDAALTRAIGAGGCTVVPKAAVPGVGWHAYVTDPSGIVFGMMQDDPGAGMEEAATAGVEAAAEPPGPTSEDARDAWSDVGERLRELGSSLSDAFRATADDEANRRRADEVKAGFRQVADSIRDASVGAAEQARPHVVSALDRAGREIEALAARLRREPEAETGADTTTEPSPDEGPPAG